MRKHWALGAFKMSLWLTIMLNAVGWSVWGLWNWLVPDLFGARPIGFWQALGLAALARILVGGFGWTPGRRWRRDRLERWERMTPEERARFREGMRGCGHHGREAAPAADGGAPA